MELRIQPRAEKDLAGLPHAVRDRIKLPIEAYAASPRDARHDVVALVGTRYGYRLRGGDWRVIFAVLEGRKAVGRKPIPKPSFLDDCMPLGFVHGERRWRSENRKRLYT